MTLAAGRHGPGPDGGPGRGPGLDVTALRALRGRGRDHTALLARVEAHLAAHDGYVALSGGKDSVVVAHLARQVDPAVPMAWFDSGLEYPEHRAYLADLAHAWDLNLTTIRADPSALEVLGGSGHWDHDAPTRAAPDLGATLIDAPAAAAHDRFGPGELWGVRAAESAGRRALYAARLRAETTRACHGCCTTPADRPGRHGGGVIARPRLTAAQVARHGGVIARRDGTTAYGPIWAWSTEDVWTYHAAHQIPPNPIYRRLQALGAPEHAQRVSTLVTATGLERGRITWLRAGWPRLYDELAAALPRLAEYT